MKTTSLLKIVAVASVLTMALVAMAQPEVQFRGQRLNYQHHGPYQDGRVVFVPLLQTAEKLGGRVEEKDNSYVIKLRGATAFYRKGEDHFRHNGANITLPSRGQNRGGVEFVPATLFRTVAGDGFVVVADRGGPFNPQRHEDRPRDDRSRTQIVFRDQRFSFGGDETPIRRGRTLLVPFRALGDKLGMRTDRTSDGKRVWIYRGDDRVEYNKGADWYRLNRDRRGLSAASEEHNGVLLVPIDLFQALARRDLSWRD